MNLLLVLFFVACTAFFVAAEYAVIRSRMSLIGQLEAEGNKKAAADKGIVALARRCAARLGLAVSAILRGDARPGSA